MKIFWRNIVMNEISMLFCIIILILVYMFVYYRIDNNGTVLENEIINPINLISNNSSDGDVTEVISPQYGKEEEINISIPMALGESSYIISNTN